MRIYQLPNKYLLNQRLIQNYLRTRKINSKLSPINVHLLSTSKCLNYAGHDPMHPVDPKKYGGDGQNYLDPEIRLRPPGPKSIEDFANPEKTGHWFSYGFDEVDKEADRYWYKMAFFLSFTFFFPLVFFTYYYMPDNQTLHAWAVREAYLELHRREKLGLPYIDPDFIPRDKIKLPPEEEIKFEVHL